MGSVFYVIAIMGCSDGGVQCSQQRVEPIRYASAAQCRAELPAALMRATDLDYPTLSAACRQIGVSMAVQPGQVRKS